MSEITLFLTSDPGGVDRFAVPPTAGPLDARNGFVARLKEIWQENARMLLVAAYPDSFQRNDEAAALMAESFRLSGLSNAGMAVWDRRTAAMDLSGYDVIVLSGGHVPTENAFFHEIQLREALNAFSGILIGISAGTMNCAGTVYAQPELTGERLDPDYQRYLPGMGLTEIQVLPHYQKIWNDELDGMPVEELTRQDSVGHCFCLLFDGSFIRVEGGKATLYGEAKLAKDGEITMLCGQEESRAI